MKQFPDGAPYTAQEFEDDLEAAIGKFALAIAGTLYLLQGRRMSMNMLINGLHEAIVSMRQSLVDRETERIIRSN